MAGDFADARKKKRRCREDDCTTFKQFYCRLDMFECRKTESKVQLSL